MSGMEPSTQRLFERVSQKLGWDRPGALDRAAEELRMSLKSRRDAVTGSDLAYERELPSDGDSSEKENQDVNGEAGTNRFLQDSSDDEFDQILAAKLTPKPESKPASRVQSSFREPVAVLSSDSDEEFEKFLTRVKTPKTQPRLRTLSGTDDSLKHFVVDDLSSDDDFIVKKKTTSIPKAKPKTPQSVSKSVKPPQTRFDSPVFVSDSDDDSDIVIKSTWRSRHSGPSSEEKEVPSNKPQMTVHVPSPLALMHTPAPFSAPPTRTGWRKDSGSSEEEFQSLLDRIRKNLKAGSTSTYASPKPPEPKAATACVTPSVRREEGGRGTVKDPRVVKTPSHVPISRPVCQTEPRPSSSSRVAVCKTPGCFLQSLSYPDSVYSRNFKQNKEELTSKLFRLYNTTVFDSKLPADMSIKWNTKMRKTAGYCVTGQEKISRTRYARIELSVKVCDSADRLRDTLVHEMCHAATWLINNVRDGHGAFWKVYARKATLMHPELPMVTRCHSYDINYKFQYQCNRCKNTIGRHSKSLDTQKFVCALCTGQLVLLTSSKPRAATPFATFVKENYGTVRQELAGQSHADVMRKLSADFASKTRLSQS